MRAPLGGAAGRDSLGRELSAGAGRGRRRAARIPARLVGGVYAANTVGAIVGSLVDEPACWSAGSAASIAQQVLIGVAALSGLLMLVPAAERDARRADARRRSS